MLRNFNILKEAIALIVGCFLLYFPYIWCKVKKENIEDYGLVYSYNKKDIKESLLISFAILLFLTPIAFWIKPSLPHTRELMQTLSFLGAGLAAAIIEETFFRGWLLTILKRKMDVKIAITLTSAIFASIHLITIHKPTVLLTFFPGLIMGYLAHRYKNIFPAIIFHFLGNVWAIWFFPF